jgi:hypothetical protein
VRAIESGFPLRPDFFFAAFRFDDWTTVAKGADEAGKTALHWAIANYGGCQRHHEPHRCTPDVISSYANIVIELIRNGADVYACWDDSSRLGATAKTSPLLALLDALGKDGDWHAAIISDAVYRWGQMLVEAGKSLTNYVVTENEFLRANRHGITFSYGRYEIFVVGLGILADNRLTLRVEHTSEVSVWRARPTRMPGAWPSPLRLEDQIILSPELPSIIIWRPDDADEQEGFRWVSAEAVKTGMHSYLVEPLDTIESHALDFISLRDPQVPGTRHFAIRDDHSLSVVMRTNESRQEIQSYTRRRSASAPTINNRQRIGRPARWDGAIHQCVTDMRWRFSSTVHPSLRDCTQDRCRKWTGPHKRGRLFNWEFSMLGDERHVQVARRFAQRFHPQCLEMVEETSARATERAQLAMGHVRPPPELSRGYY